MQRSFLGLIGTKRNERIFYFNDPFKLVPVTQLAEIADKFTRNEILTGNELRGFMGIAPSKDPKADQLRNSNMPQTTDGLPTDTASVPADQTGGDLANSAIDDISNTVDQIFKDLGVGP